MVLATNPGNHRGADDVVLSPTRTGELGVFVANEHPEVGTEQPEDDEREYQHDLNEARADHQAREESQEPLRSAIRLAQLNGSGPIGRNAIVSSARAEPRSSCSRMANARATAAPATTSRWSASESAFASGSSFNKHGRGPRIHDLRHTFAVRTIMDWYRRGLDPDREMLKLSTYLGHTTLTTPTGTSRRSRNCCSSPANAPNGTSARGSAMKTHPLPIYLQRFFSERLATQLHASPNTVASYRDTFRLLLKYAADRLGRAADCSFRSPISMRTSLETS